MKKIHKEYKGCINCEYCKTRLFNGAVCTNGLYKVLTESNYYRFKPKWCPKNKAVD